jgi:hypothetical protein
MDAEESQSIDHILIVCRDSLAFLLMFNVTSRCTFNKLVSRSASQHFKFKELTPIKFIGFFQHSELIAAFNFVSAVLYIGTRG